MKGLGGSVTMAFEGTHKISSATQSMFQPVDQSFKKTQQLKSQGQAFINTSNFSLTQKL